MTEIKQSLTKEQIKIFEDLMNCKVDLAKTPSKKKHQDCYWVIDKSNKARWRKVSDILQYISFKVNKIFPTNLPNKSNNKLTNKVVNKVPTNLPNNIHNKVPTTLSLTKKDKVIRISLSLKTSTIKFLKSKSKSSGLSVSSIADQIISNVIE